MPNVLNVDIAIVDKKKISINKYNKMMDKITRKGKSVSDTLIAMLEEASKYEICEHIFQAAHGSCFGSGSISYHGKCKKCGIEMSMYGQVNEQGHGEVTIRAVDGYKRKKKI